MAKCTPDMHNAIVEVSKELQEKGGKLFLSDLFRSYDMQLQSHLDWKSGRKKAFSPAPGGSLHEAGRAFDLDLGSIKVSLADFWEIAKKHGLFPIIDSPNPRKSEAWHFDCRGSHDVVYNYYRDGHGTNISSPYKAMAMSAILAIGVKVDLFGKNQKEAYLQSMLVRLGHRLGSIDGQIGMKTRTALQEAGVADGSVDEMIMALEDLLQAKFPGEYSITHPLDTDFD